MEDNINSLYADLVDKMRERFKKKITFVLYCGPQQERCIPYGKVLGLGKGRFKETETGIFELKKSFMFEVVKEGRATRLRTTFKDGTAVLDIPVTNDYRHASAFKVTSSWVTMDSNIYCDSATIKVPSVWFV